MSHLFLCLQRSSVFLSFKVHLFPCVATPAAVAQLLKNDNLQQTNLHCHEGIERSRLLIFFRPHNYIVMSRLEFEHRRAAEAQIHRNYEERGKELAKASGIKLV